MFRGVVLFSSSVAPPHAVLCSESAKVKFRAKIVFHVQGNFFFLDLSYFTCIEFENESSILKLTHCLNFKISVPFLIFFPSIILLNLFCQTDPSMQVKVQICKYYLSLLSPLLLFTAFSKVFCSALIASCSSPRK